MLSYAWAAPLRDAPSCSIVTPDSADAAFAVLGSAEPAVIRGLVAGLPEVESLLQGNRSVRLVANPTPVAPLKRHGDTLVRPAELSLSLDEAVALLEAAEGAGGGGSAGAAAGAGTGSSIIMSRMKSI